MSGFHVLINGMDVFGPVAHWSLANEVAGEYIAEHAQSQIVEVAYINA